MDRSILLQNIGLWRSRIAEASAKWGGAEICAVTKTRSAEEINAAWDGGIRTVGENRVQELMEKYDALNPDYTVHLIGSLQTNKVKYIIGRVDMVQSLDRMALAEELSRRAQAKNRVMDVLVQVNIAREAQKSGIAEEDILPFLNACAALPGIHPRGLMAIMPLTDDPEEVRPYFKRMRAWYDRLRDTYPDWDTLSMGMTNDCIVAAEEGATMVRLGRALFGARS